MPNQLAHLMLGASALKDAGGISFQGAAQLSAFALGTQGPDPLLFDRLMPWRKKRRTSELGGIMHRKNVQLFVEKLLSIISLSRERGREEAANLQLMWLMGFSAHAALDRNAHPYVYWRTGVPGDGRNHTKCHLRFEAEMDNELRAYPGELLPAFEAMKMLGLRRKSFRLPPKQLKMLCEGLAEAITAAQGICISPEHLGDSIKLFRFARCLLDDRFGILGAFAAFISRLGYTDALCAFPKPPPYPHDPLNKSKAEWRQPFEPHGASTSAFSELFLIAEREAADAITTLQKWWQGSASTQEAAKAVGNRALNTGIDCDSSPTMTRHDCIYWQGDRSSKEV